jgi:excisionase family DNA binding protein
MTRSVPSKHKLPMFFTTREVADLLGVSVRTVRREVAKKRLMPHRIGGQHRFAEADVDTYLASAREAR